MFLFFPSIIYLFIYAKSPYKMVIFFLSPNKMKQVKIWKIPPEVLKEHITTPLCSISQPKKISAVQYHPIADNLLFTAAGDFSAKYVLSVFYFIYYFPSSS
jgi:hypothetical protein